MIGQFFGQEIIKKLTRIGNASVQFQAGSKLRLGGLGAILKTVLNLSTGVSGLGGIDIGSISAGKYYYVYAVISGSTVGLVASLSSIAPTGFLAYRKIGAFNTEQLSSNVEQVMSFGEQPDSELYVHEGIGPASINNRFGRFTGIQRIKGLEIEYVPSLTLGDKFQCGKAGIYQATLGYADTLASGQEFGVTINSDAFGTTNMSGTTIPNPHLRFSEKKSRPQSNLSTNCSGTAFLEDNSYLHVHGEQASSISSGSANYMEITKRGKDEIDWSI